MKNLRYLLLPLLVLILTASISASNAPKKKTQISDNSVNSLLVGVESENFGLQTSAAFMLGEIRSSKAVIPLMRMLRNSDKEEARIMAALSLYKIESAKGMYLVQQAAKYDSSERVRKICQTLYFNSLGIEPDSHLKGFVSKW